LLPGLSKTARRQLNKKKSVKRLYTRKKLSVNASNYRQRNRRQLYSISHGRKLIKKLKLHKRR
jgi:hypothetical protein